VRIGQIAVIRPKPDWMAFPSYHDAGLTIIFTGRSLDHRAGFRRGLAAQTTEEALGAPIATGEAAAIDQVLPDTLGVAAPRPSQLDAFPVGLAVTPAGGYVL